MNTTQANFQTENTTIYENNQNVWQRALLAFSFPSSINSKQGCVVPKDTDDDDVYYTDSEYDICNSGNSIDVIEIEAMNCGNTSCSCHSCFLSEESEYEWEDEMDGDPPQITIATTTTTTRRQVLCTPTAPTTSQFVRLSSGMVTHKLC
jgi:hypothetical protein